MNSIIILGGNLQTNEKLKKIEFKFTEIKFNTLFLDDLLNSENKEVRNAGQVLLNMYSSKKVNYRRQLFFIYNLAKKIHLSYSMRIRCKQILNLHVHPKNIFGLKSWLTSIAQFNNIFLYSFFVFGILRIPKSLIIKLLKVNFKELNSFQETLFTKNSNFLIVFTTGVDNISFLLALGSKEIHLKKIQVILNWDNPSSKAFIPDIYDKVALWNKNQINDVVKFSDIQEDKLFVIGSLTADRAYQKYALRRNRNKPGTARLLFLGQQNRCDELGELKFLLNKINSESSLYKTLTYRPNPNSKRKISKKILDDLGIQLSIEPEIDLVDFAGIVTLPSTMLLEVLMSGVPAVIYTPRHPNFLFDPETCWKYYHFRELKSFLRIPVIKSRDALAEFLQFGIPEHKFVLDDQFQRIFPYFEKDFASRINDLVLE